MIRSFVLLACAVVLLPATASAQSFLANDDGDLFGVPMVFDPDPTIRDFGVDQIDGNVVWDFFGTGAFYLQQGELISGRQPGTQIWHVNFPTKIRRQITSGQCVPGISGLESSYLCGHISPVAVSTSGHFAYVQNVTYKYIDGNYEYAAEGRSYTVVIATLSTAEAVVVGKPADMAWSPDGKWLLMTVGNGLSMINRESGKICDYPDITTGYQIQGIDWGSRNGGEIAYAAGGNIWLLPMRPPSRNRCARINSNKIVQLTNTDDRDQHPQWVGNFVGFASNRASTGDSNENIWAVNPDTLVTAIIATADGIDLRSREADWYGGRK